MVHLRWVMLVPLVGLVMALTPVPTQAADYIDAPAPQVTPAPMAGEVFLLHGELGVQTDPARNHVSLQRLDSGTWRTVTSMPSTEANGLYSFKWRISTATSFRVTAYTTSGPKALSATRYVRVTAQSVQASIERVCDSNHDCVSQAKATGQVSPVRENRRVVLQYRSGSTWKSHSATAYTDEHGKFETPPFSIAGWPQWSAKQLRIVATSYQGSTYAVSPLISFMPGPTQLGDNVLRVDVAGGAFPQTKGVDYTGYATLIKNGVREIDGARLDKFGVRGSASSTYPKKPYNLRFATPPTGPVFEMGPDRSWTLLAMYVDQSFVRDKTALDMGRKLSGMTWNPDSEYVELFVNSEYKGAYLMVEKVRIDGDKVDVDKDTGMIMEVDMPTVSDSRKGFKTSVGGLVFAFKDPDSYGGSEGITSQKLSAIQKKLAAVEWYLYSSSRRSYYEKQIDRDSAADFHLAQEFFKDIDADFWRSKYFSWDMVNGSCGNELCDGRLHFGPLWDFGQSVGNVDPTNPSMAYIRSYRGWAANGTGSVNRPTYRTHWFVQLWKVPAFRSYLAYRWNEVRTDFYEAAKYEVDNNKALIGWGAANDRRRWAGSAKIYKPKGSTYDHEVQYVKSWLLNRFTWIDSQL